MGLITERLKVVAKYVGDNKVMVDQLEYAGEVIEAELEELSERIDKELRGRDSTIEGLKKDVLDVYEMLAQGTKRIEALKKDTVTEKCLLWDENVELTNRIEQLERDVRRLDTFLESIPPEPMPPDVPTDKDGKPERGLEPGDVISYIADSENERFHNQKCLGQFHHKEETKIYAYWQVWKTGEMSTFLSFMEQDQVTFESRPKFQEKDC